MIEERSDLPQNDKQLQFLLEAIKNIQFGSVTAQIQDGRIVQIEKNEKLRFRN